MDTKSHDWWRPFTVLKAVASLFDEPLQYIQARFIATLIRVYWCSFMVEHVLTPGTNLSN